MLETNFEGDVESALGFFTAQSEFYPDFDELCRQSASPKHFLNPRGRGMTLNERMSNHARGSLEPGGVTRKTGFGRGAPPVLELPPRSNV